MGIHLHPHLFRHTFATKALNQGIPIEIVQILLGHSKIETTQIYAKVRENNIEYFYKKLHSIYNKTKVNLVILNYC